MVVKYDAQESMQMLRKNLAQHEAATMEHLRQVCGLTEAEWPHERLQAHTRRGLDWAVHWRLHTDQDILSFLILRHEFGERFDEFPSVRKALKGDELPQDNRIAGMMMLLPMAIWDVVKRRTPAGPSAPLRGMHEE